MLTSERVKEIFSECIFRKGEDTGDPIQAEGILLRIEFHPGRLNGYMADIIGMLEELPEDFKNDQGGGLSFFKGDRDQHGKIWATSHQSVEQLFQLGMAIGCVTSRLSGGIPHFIFCPV